MGEELIGIKMTKNRQEESLSKKVLIEGIRATVLGLGVPTLYFMGAVLTRPLTDANIDEIANDPHVMLSGVYTYAGLKALGLTAQAKRFIQEKIYSPEILNLEDQLRTASLDGRIDDFEGLVNNLYKAFEQRGKNGKERIDKKHKDAYRRTLWVTFDGLGKAIKEGNPEALEKEWDKYRDIVANYQRTFESIEELTGRTRLSFSRLQHQCAPVYVDKKVEDLEAQLDGYADNKEKKRIKTVSKGLSGLTASLMGMRLYRPNYETMRGEINRLKEISVNFGLRKSERVEGFEKEFYVLELLNTKLFELYDFAEQTGDLQGVKQRFEAVKPSLTRYKDLTVDEAYRRILLVVDETQIKNDRMSR